MFESHLSQTQSLWPSALAEREHLHRGGVHSDEGPALSERFRGLWNRLHTKAEAPCLGGACHACR